MGDSVVGILIALWVLSAMNVLDVTIDISPHVKGEKVVCIRGKATPTEVNGQ